MTIEPSCRDNSFPKLSHAAALAVIADLGIRGVDLSVSARHPHITPDEVIDDPKATAATVRRHLDELHLQVADVFALPLGASLTDYPINHPDASRRETSRRYFEALVELAVAVGAPGITLLPGIPVAEAGQNPQQGRLRGTALAAAELAWRVEVASARGLEVSFEPHGGSVAPTPQAALELVEQTPGLKVTLDHSHFVAQHIPATDADCLVGHTRHIQARQAAPGSLQEPARRGTIDFPRFIALLEAAGYQGWFGIEYMWNERQDNLDCISETALLRDVLLHSRGPR